MTVARVGVHALVVLVLLHVLFGLARLFSWPAIVGILEFASAGWFVWVALATSAASTALGPGIGTTLPFFLPGSPALKSISLPCLKS